VLRAEALVGRELLAQHLELCNELRAASERELGLDPRLDGAEPQLLQTPCLQVEGEAAGHVDVRVAAPERERCAEPLCRRRRLHLHERCGLLDHSLELDRVDVPWVGDEPVTSVVANDDVPDRGPEVRDVRLQRRSCSGRWLVAPHAVDQRVHRDRRAHLRRKQREHRALPRSTQTHAPVIAHHFERAEDPDFQVEATIRRFAGSA
jgi:hypothetical protein